MTETASAGPLDLRRPSAGSVRRTIVGALRTQWRSVAVALVATVVGSVAIAVGPSLIRHGIDDGIGAGDRDALRLAAIGYLVALGVGGVTGGIRATAMAVGAERFIHRLRVDALAGVLRVDLRTYETTRRGDLLARVTADTEALSGAARWVIPDTVRYVTDLLAALVAVALLEPVLALLTLVALPPMAAAGRALRVRSAVVYPRYRAEIGALVGQVTETVEGADTIRAHGRHDDRLDLLRAANRIVSARYLDGTAMRNRFYASLTVTRVTATAIVLIAASLFAVDGRVTVGTAAAGVLAVSVVFGPLGWLTELLDDALSAKAALDRVVAAATIPEPPCGTTPLPYRGDLVFDDVSFSYVPGRTVLTGVDLVFCAGSRTALVGQTGAGKSTIARLAAGLATPDRGVVHYHGLDLTHARADDRRRRLLFVPQEPFCITGTIADNLRFADPVVTDDRLRHIAGTIGLGDWIDSHPDGLGRDCGTNGSRLSDGERQLVAVLRVALADPAVVILDEATATLDPATEALVGTALDRALADRTVVVIAHRPETAARCDQQIIVAHGAVTRPVSNEFGTFEIPLL